VLLWLHSNSQVDLAIIILTIQVGASTLDLNGKWAVLDLAMKW